ncbi:MAG: divalent cation tolerance protein CutA [Thermoplasmatota archaeon]
MYIIRTSVGSEPAADDILRAVMSQHKAACCYLYEVASHYWWAGELREEKEYILEFKVGDRDGLKDALISSIRDLHPYDLPVIEVIRAEVDEEVGDWANDPRGHTPQI